jgi:hypothetical protein
MKRKYETEIGNPGALKKRKVSFNEAIDSFFEAQSAESLKSAIHAFLKEPAVQSYYENSEWLDNYANKRHAVTENFGKFFINDATLNFTKLKSAVEEQKCLSKHRLESMEITKAESLLLSLFQIRRYPKPEEKDLEFVVEIMEKVLEKLKQRYKKSDQQVEYDDMLSNSDHESDHMSSSFEP